MTSGIFRVFSVLGLTVIYTLTRQSTVLFAGFQAFRREDAFSQAGTKLDCRWSRHSSSYFGDRFFGHGTESDTDFLKVQWCVLVVKMHCGLTSWCQCRLQGVTTGNEQALTLARSLPPVSIACFADQSSFLLYKTGVLEAAVDPKRDRAIAVCFGTRCGMYGLLARLFVVQQLRHAG